MINKIPGKPETDAQRDWRLAFSAGLDDAIWYLVGKSIRASNLSLREHKQRWSLFKARASAARAVAYADAAVSLARKRHRLSPMMKSSRDEIEAAYERAQAASREATHG